MRNYLLLVLFCGLFITSCRTEQRAIQNYVEDLQDTTMRISRYMAEPVIQKNDLLSIRIRSASLEESVDQLYNLQTGTGGSAAVMNSPMNAYLVDQRGEIEMPRIGLLKVEGLTKTQLAEQIKEKLKSELTDPMVNIRFQNFRVIIMGEVGDPGVQTVPVENLTVLEALAMAGDITQFGNKTSVKVLRENDGQRRLGIIDLTSSKMFESPYYQLQQNDVVLVQATRYKARNAEQQRIAQQVGFVLTIVTSIAVVYNIFTR
ncbi:polysaccharide biosynthesis/export family protein [Pseudocnuella soli]|uniref:polysaccharide biosynthesis/export family protein n=1 Tax=Pseudocnuella soli TaxID=2502779 RepID=UPI0010514E5B|nr:polysaccharide biosynthesis/export family protein [Pseudocnuella soli]